MSSIRTRVAHPVEERPAVLIGAKLRARAQAALASPSTRWPSPPA